ncbi:MAG: ABC transporter ATP-binding protein [Pseudomonadota bacterium]
MTLRVTDLSYAYGPKTALDGVSFTLAPGFCALLGPNGAGKSTLFALLTRLFAAPPPGRIEIAGSALEEAPRRAMAALGVVFQQPTLDLDLTVQQNLMYFAALHGVPRRVVSQRIVEALGQLDMAERAGEKVRKLNGGHRRRTELARALLHDPKVLLLDEPTVGLDPASREAITAHVHRLAEGGMTVLWATHLTDEVQDSDRLLILHQGRLLADGTVADVTGGQPLKQHFLSLTADAAA